MTTQRKVRKDFDTGKEYSVNVLECTEEEKKEVQQAFFDAGFPWRVGGKKYRCLDAVQYSNALVGRGVTAHLLYSDTTTAECNMSAKEFLELVYEPEQRGHVHSELMAKYAEDAMKELNEEIKLTLNLMQTDIDDGAHDELQGHLYSLLEIKRNALQQRLVERSWVEKVAGLGDGEYSSG